MDEFRFDVVRERRGTDSVKWDVPPGELPMWVADMDFGTAPAIREAITARAEQDIYGYTVLPKKWHDAYADWWKDRHGLRIEKEWLSFCTGVMPAVSCAVSVLSAPGAGVIVQPPVYYVFFHAIRLAGRRVVESPLVYHEDSRTYSMDYEDLERKLADPGTEVFLLCNPQNPGGRLWNREELQRAGDLCRRYGVTVISDEIHCDITRPGTSYVPLASLGPEFADISVTCISPTKAFNLAGIRSAAAFVPNHEMREKFEEALAVTQVNEPNVFAGPAAVTAFEKGGPWLREMCTYVYANMDFVTQFIEEHLPMLKVVPEDATYLMWIDCSAVTDDTTKFCKELREETGLFVSNGHVFGGNGRRFIRMNVACPRVLVEDGMERMRRFIEKR